MHNSAPGADCLSETGTAGMVVARLRVRDMVHVRCLQVPVLDIMHGLAKNSACASTCEC